MSLEWKEVGRWVADHLGRVRLPGVFGLALGDTGFPDIIGKTLQVCAFHSGRRVHAFHRLSKKAETARKSVYCLRVWNYAPCMFFSFHLNAKNRKSSWYNVRFLGWYQEIVVEGCMGWNCMWWCKRAESGLGAHLILLHIISYAILIASWRDRNLWEDIRLSREKSGNYCPQSLCVCAQQINTASRQRPFNSHTLSSPWGIWGSCRTEMCTAKAYKCTLCVRQCRWSSCPQ